MQEVIDQVGRILNRKIVVETDPAKVRPVERDHLQADVSRLKSLIGWAPHSDHDRALREHGICDCQDVAMAVLEVDGSISCLKYDEIKQQAQPHPSKRRYLKKHQ